jgi:hypothetical protein
VDSSNRIASSNTSNRMVWTENLARYHLTRPEEGKLVKRYLWVGLAGAEYWLCDTTVIYEPSPFEVQLPQSVQPTYVSEDPIRFREESSANDAADQLYARLISEGWQIYGESPSKHKQQ